MQLDDGGHSFIHLHLHTSKQLFHPFNQIPREIRTHANKSKIDLDCTKHTCMWLLLWPQDLHRIRALYHASTIANMIRHRQVPFNDEGSLVGSPLTAEGPCLSHTTPSLTRQKGGRSFHHERQDDVVARSLSRARGDSLVDRNTPMHTFLEELLVLATLATLEWSTTTPTEPTHRTAQALGRSHAPAPRSRPPPQRQELDCSRWLTRVALTDGKCATWCR